MDTRGHVCRDVEEAFGTTTIAAQKLRPGEDDLVAAFQPSGYASRVDGGCAHFRRALELQPGPGHRLAVELQCPPQQTRAGHDALSMPSTWRSRIVAVNFAGIAAQPAGR